MEMIHELTADERLQCDVLDALYADPEITATNIGVEVADGMVTLTGTVASLEEGLEAECTTLQISAVRRIRNDLDVR